MAEDKKKDEIAIIEINEEFMKQKLYEFRGCKVLLDADLAEVYGYELKAFNQQVKRNIERFQNDMMFQLSDNEVEYLRSQFVTANQTVDKGLREIMFLGAFFSPLRRCFV